MLMAEVICKITIVWEFRIEISHSLWDGGDGITRKRVSTLFVTNSIFFLILTRAEMKYSTGSPTHIETIILSKIE